MSAAARAGARATRRRRGIDRTLPAVALGVAGVFALAGCAAGADGASGSGHDGHAMTETAAPASAGTAADVMFAQMMIPHHEQALEMSGIVLAKDGLDPEVAALAGEIQAAQGPEIAQLEAWLEEWDAPREMPGGGHGMSGMLSDDELAALEAADAASASQLFLEQMIEHHEGAVDMAEEQLASGSHEGAIEMAEAIIATQTAEIERMEALLVQ
ncbi:DUF305 domain-containing protein [Agromyces sp. Root81]|uniref:DUF305 domain-containing protein n=1 Tax=Agromyces sp. Root81 TaxID=1736601 RepID=UPI0009E8B873|nr:DUF305 domain-containing protein [Agromyces sp. Root81]